MSGRDWNAIRRILEARGLWDADGVSRRARARLCRCGAPVMVGLDHDNCAMPAICDPAPLNALGEVQALMEGRTTYELSRILNTYVLDYRDADNIKAHPAGSGALFEVLAAHKCGIEYAPTMQAPKTILNRNESETSDEPPF